MRLDLARHLDPGPSLSGPRNGIRYRSLWRTG